MAMADNVLIIGGDGPAEGLSPTLGDLVRSGELSLSDVKEALEAFLRDSAPLRVKDGLYVSLSEQDIDENIKEDLVEILLAFTV